MRCPTCGADTSVIETRSKGDPAGSFVYRRRDCKAGCARFTTFEVPESGNDPIQVAFADRVAERRAEAERALGAMWLDIDAFRRVTGAR